MRLRTLPVSVAGVVAGGGCAAYYHCFRPLPFTICLLFAVMAQIASNFANEYFDFKNGLDRKGREGFRRGVTEGDISPRAMLAATFALLAFACAVGCTLIIWGGWWLIAAGAAIAVFAMAYSAGPLPLSHHGLGEVAVIIFFGIVPVTLTAYVQAQSWMTLPVALPVSVAIGLMGANVLIVNNYRDADDDRAVNKKTTAVIVGRGVMGKVYFINGIIATLCQPALYAMGETDSSRRFSAESRARTDGDADVRTVVVADSGFRHKRLVTMKPAKHDYMFRRCLKI